MYSLSLSVATAPSVVWCVVEYMRQLEVRRVTEVSHVLYFFFVCGLKRDLVVVVCVWWVRSFFSLLHPSLFLLAVFGSASAFNQDVSKWNTGAVTIMECGKCTLSPSLWPTTRV